MKRNARVDSNQAEVVKLLRKMGYFVQHTHQLKGCFDFLIGKADVWIPVELKDSDKMPKKFFTLNEEEQKEYLVTKLTEDEKIFYDKITARNLPFIIEITAERIDFAFNILKK